MIATPEILLTKAAAVIRLTLSRHGLMQAFGPAVGELMAVLAQQGIAPLAAILAHHHTMSPILFDFELGAKIAAPLQAAGRVTPGELPAARPARRIYSGPHEEVSSAWDEFNDWMKNNGNEAAENLWQHYSLQPQTTPDPAEWHKKLNRPLNSASAGFPGDGRAT